MKSSFKTRLMRLEARAVVSRMPPFRTGYLTCLPADFVGERHIVILSREITDSPSREWCDFEERPGPAPPGLDDDGALTVYLTS
jgi:hypothetical protein